MKQMSWIMSIHVGTFILVRLASSIDEEKR